MTIYEIDEKLMALTDPETGEISDYEEFEKLQMTREEKIEGMACWVKDLEAEAKALREEEKALAERRRADERKIESLKSYLSKILDGEKFRSTKAQISFRKSKAVYIPDEEKFMEGEGNSRFMKATWSIDKKAVKEALNNEEEIPGASLQENNSIQIK